MFSLTQCCRRKFGFFQYDKNKIRNFIFYTRSSVEEEKKEKQNKTINREDTAPKYYSGQFEHRSTVAQSPVTWWLERFSPLLDQCLDVLEQVIQLKILQQDDYH